MAEAQPGDAGPGVNRTGASVARVAAILALVVAFVLVGTALFGGGAGHQYKLIFETGGQLVTGNQVLVGGQPIGEVNDLTLTEDGQAQVQITVDEPLHEGTTAVVRATSLSGIANRYVSITPGPNNAPELPDDATLNTDETTAPVDLDQLFDTLDGKTRAALRKVFEGSAGVYVGAEEDANKSYKYFAPALSSTTKLLDEITRDQPALTRFLVDGAAVFGAIDQRREDLAALTQNANEGLGAIARENVALDRALAALPPFMRQANTTFVNLRAALDDLDPLVEASLPATKDLPEFLRDLRSVTHPAVPVIDDLALAVNRDGSNNDLTDALRRMPALQRSASKASPAAIDALDATQDNLAKLRPYTPDLLAWLTHFGQVTAYYDSFGHYARVSPTDSNIFAYNSGTGALDPIPPSQQFDGVDFGIFERCPGASTQVPADASAPFTDPPFATAMPTGECDPSDIPPGSFP
jgi:phospholipid/cholesterol/gamma-HCH transport system substrate-binding protein